jgi:DNA-binding response OmpR family regulator
MKILVAEDDLTTRRMLKAMLERWGFEVVGACDGNEAWQILHKPDSPRLAILDWMMPGMDGVEICRKARELVTTEPIYLIVLTGKTSKENIVAGLQAGANDYITKPFSGEELRARVQVGRGMVELQSTLAARVRELQEALQREKRIFVKLKMSNDQLRKEAAKRKEAEEELLRARDEVNKLLAERTAKLSLAGELIKRSITRFRDITES